MLSEFEANFFIKANCKTVYGNKTVNYQKE